MKVLKPHVVVLSSNVIIVDPHIENGFDASPPFYISLNAYEKILHNFLMDSRAFHNVIPKVFVEEMGL